jgi:hypothetical protein
MTVRFAGSMRAQVLQPDVMNRFEFTAGEKLTAKQVVAKGESDGSIYQAQASDSTRMPAIGVVLNSPEAGEKAYVTNQGIIKNIAGGGSFGRDEAIYVSDTKGQATNSVPASVGNFVQVIGRSINSTDVMVSVDERAIRLDQV